MKLNLLNVAIACFLLSPVWVKGQEKEIFQSDLKTDKKPWTDTNFANDPDDFQFVIITDRTGSPRDGIFEDAIKKINWLMPEFVITVGDLIRGAKGKDSVKLKEQWDEHFDRIDPLKMPFFHLAGNHDIKANNTFQVEYWNKLFGAEYYAFVYKNVLFMCLFSNQGTQVLNEEQVDYFKSVLEKHHDVRWTMVFLHHPLWRYPHMSNFSKIEKLLSKRDFTVFAGHQHQYHHSIKNNSNYYVLATTGGGSPLLGNSFGSFDHVTWVTMSDEGPIVANIRLDGILSRDVANEETHELTQQLLKSIQVETNILVDSQTNFKEGKALITYKNESDEPLYLDGEFFHSHHVVASPSTFSIVIDPHDTETIEIDLTAIQPFDLMENIELEYNSTIGYRLEKYPDLELSGRVLIPIKRSDYKIFPTREVEFIESFLVNMGSPVAGTSIKYTMDGSDPTLSSLNYDRPFEIGQSTTIKARVFTKDGSLQSNVMTLKAKMIKPGKGLWVAHYAYNLRAKSSGNIPVFEALDPTKISTTRELDPVKVSGKKDQFGLVYKGEINIPQSGKYLFKAISDDGIRILIDGREVVSDPVKHKAREASGEMNLKKGKYPIEIQYFQWKRNYAMDIEYTSPDGKTHKLDTDILSYNQNADFNE